MKKQSVRIVLCCAILIIPLRLSADLIPIKVLLSYAATPCGQGLKLENREHELNLLNFRDMESDASTAYKKKMLDCQGPNASQCAKAASDELRKKLIQIQKLRLDEENRHQKQVDRINTLCRLGIP